MLALWLLQLALSLWQVQAVGVLHDPFALDTPLPVVNLLQIGSQNDVPVSGSLFSDLKKTPVGNILGHASNTLKNSPLGSILSSRKTTPAQHLYGNRAVPPQGQPAGRHPGVPGGNRRQNVAADDIPTIDGEPLQEGNTSVLHNLEKKLPEPIGNLLDKVKSGQKSTDLGANLPGKRPTGLGANVTGQRPIGANSRVPAQKPTGLGGNLNGDKSTDSSANPNGQQSTGTPDITGQKSTGSSANVTGDKSTDSSASSNGQKSGGTPDVAGQKPAVTDAAPAKDGPKAEPETPQPEVKLSVTEDKPAEGETEQTANPAEPLTVLPEGTTTLITDEEAQPTVEEIKTVSFDENDMQKNASETSLGPNDVIDGGKDSMSKMTMNVDQDWLDKERAVDTLQKRLPFGTGYSYKKGAQMLTPVSEKPKVMGGVLQTLIDKEAEVRRRRNEAVQIEHDLRLRVTRETADVINLLSNGKLSELKSGHPLVFARLVEPLKSSIALSHLNKTAQNIISFYDRDWYVRSSPKERAMLLENIRKDTGRQDLYTLKFNKPKKMTPEKERVYQILDGYFNDYQCQKIVRGNQVAKQMLRMFDQASGFYVAPFYSDVVPTLGSTWLTLRFEKFYSQSEYLRGEVLAKSMPQMVGRFMAMVENGTILPTSIDIQMSLFSLAAVLSKIMDGVTEPTNFLGKRKFYGYMGMCDSSCARGIVTNLMVDDPAIMFILNKQREILRWISLYLRDDLLRIDTTIQRLLIEIMFRTTNDMKYRFSNENVNLHVKSEYTKPENKASLLELPQTRRIISAVPKIRRIAAEMPKKTAALKKKMDNMQTPQFITNMSKSASAAKFNGFIDRLGSGFRRFMSGYRLPGRMVDNKLDAKAIAPYNAFKTPRKVVASLDDGLLQMVEVAVDLVNLRSTNDINNLYYQAFNTWVQIQAFHNAIHAFEEMSSKKRSSSKTLGAIFRHLNTSTGKHIEGMPKQFLPFTSLILQICFFIENSIDGFKRSNSQRFKEFFKGILTVGFKSRLGPSNFTELQSYLEPQVVYHKSKYVVGRAIISNLVHEFKLMFLNKPAIPMPIIQAVTMFLGMWARGTNEKLDLSDNNIDIARRVFFLNYMSNRYDLPMAATEIVVQHCAATAPILYLGCVARNVRGRIVCKDVSIVTNKYNVLKVMQLIDATSEDPLDVIRIGSDLARRCKAMPVRKNVVPKRKKDRKPESFDTAIMFSELAHRYHCYQEQASVVNQIIKVMVKTNDLGGLSDTVDRIFGSSRALTIRQTDQSESGPTLICPFMEDAPDELRDRYRDRMVAHATSQMTLKRRITESLKDLGDKRRDKLAGPVAVGASGAASLESIAGAILVGTRQYDGIFFYGGYPPPEKITVPPSVTVKPGDGRVVFHGKEFVAELEVLRPLGVKAVVMEKTKKISKRVYYMESGERLDELLFGQESSDFVVRAHVLTTASTLREMGYDIGKFIWCGYEHGWVADFALHNIIGNSDVPVFNGAYWLLSKQMTVADVIGKKVRIRHGEELMDENIDDVNLDIRSGDGKVIAKYPARKGTDADFANHGGNSFTFDTGYGEVSPGAIEDLIRDAEFDPTTNTLMVNLDAPGSVLMESPIRAAGDY
ncbi:rhoptry neck protein, putative [Babesia ovis]|uniref:Rhoptry neck protein, putative n=1 Tax=Babesia ovis TaxID=5869 RepID=A0A9W5TAK5_BABOV|nr:rhoptry neck protein, putative [Babesia ovis]